MASASPRSCIEVAWKPRSRNRRVAVATSSASRGRIIALTRGSPLIKEGATLANKRLIGQELSVRPGADRHRLTPMGTELGAVLDQRGVGSTMAFREPRLAELDPALLPQWSVMANGHSTRTVRINARSAALIEAEALLDAIGDRTRRAILLELRDGPQPVGELARRLPVGRPAVSQHLKVLKDARLVTSRQDGTRRRYELALAGIRALRGWLDGLWDRALDAYRVAAEQQDEGRG